MPLQSREVITLRLILECHEESQGGHAHPARVPHQPSLLRLPVEVRLKILRHLLRIDRTRKAHTRRPAKESVEQLLWLALRRILEAPPFKSKGNQELNGTPPVINTCRLETAIMKVNKQLYWEGKTVLYLENKVVGLQSGIRGLGAKLNNYGLPILGPVPSSRLIGSPDAAFQSEISQFDPIMLFRGQSVKATGAWYLCSYKDAADLMHALWIMIQSPFARGMRYSLTISAKLPHRHISRMDGFVKYAVLPWLHDHITSIDFHGTSISRNPTIAEHSVRQESAKRVDAIRAEWMRHVAASRTDPNLYTYGVICAYLERILRQAETVMEHNNFLIAEMLYERVCFEASSILRTRSGKLVDISSKLKEGINRVCKLIAVSSYRLCELRSGWLAEHLYEKHRTKAGQQQPSQITEKSASQGKELKDLKSVNGSSSNPSGDQLNSRSKNWHNGPFANYDFTGPRTCGQETTIVREAASDAPKFRTTRLEPQLAKELALTNGLLAMRLPCATPVYEWNLRLDIMLLRLFAEGEDANARLTLKRLERNFKALTEDAKEKGKTGHRWDAFYALRQELDTKLRPGASKPCYKTLAAQCQKAVGDMWGERLVVNPGYTGLVWMFRWSH